MPVLASVGLPFLPELVAITTVSVVIAYVCYRLKLVPIAGFLIAGAAIGPHALGLVPEQETVDVLAEIGVILLLFTIGLEFSLSKLARIGRAIFVGGGIQVGLAVGVVAGGLVAAGVSWQEGVYTGCLVALSSTAIVLGILATRGETDTPAGRLALAILIFQDLAIVAMVLLVPTLAGTGGGLAGAAWMIGRAVLVIAAVLLLARRAVPWLLARVADTRQPTLFLLALVAICFGTAAIGAMAGLSLALGAFLAGLVVSESPYSEHAFSEVLPLRELFSAVFFVSVGMLLDLGFLIEHPLLVLGAAVGVVLLKAATTGVAVLALGYPVRLAAATGLTLAQIGEFSFVLERSGRVAGLSPAGLGVVGEQTFVAATVLLMLATPALVGVGPGLGRLLTRTKLGRLGNEPDTAGGEGPPMEDHTIIIGYGPAGKRLVEVLQHRGIPFEVIEMNPTSAEALRAKGITALYGDATRHTILEHAGIERAKLLVIAINDPAASPRIVSLARHLNPTLQIVVRTRYLVDVERLQELGADIVVPEEMETTVRLFSHVLGAYMVPSEEVERQVQAIRAEDYGVLRGSIQEAHLMVLQGLDEEGLHTRAVAVRPGAPAAGKTLAELELRRTHRLTALTVRRGTNTHASPDGDFVLEPGDRLVLIGMAEDFATAAPLFRTPTVTPAATAR